MGITREDEDIQTVNEKFKFIEDNWNEQLLDLLRKRVLLTDEDLLTAEINFYKAYCRKLLFKIEELKNGRDKMQQMQSGGSTSEQSHLL